MKKKLWLLLTLSCILLLAAMPVSAAKNKTKKKAFFKTSDGVLQILSPGPQWHVIQDPAFWFVISDGGNQITISHYRNGEALPAPEVAGDEFEGVYHTYVSTEDEVFVIKGSAVRQEDLAIIMKAVSTITLLKPGTKTAVKKEADPSSIYSIKEMDETFYSTSDHLNVRNGFSTNDRALGHLTYGEAVKVTGSVLAEGKEIGWYRILFNDSTAFASASYLTRTKPETPSREAVESARKETEEEPFTVYDRNWNAVRIYRVGDFTFRDFYGNTYNQVRGSMYMQEESGVLYSVDPNYWSDEEYRAAAEAESFTVYAEDGSTASIFINGDGNYSDQAGRTYMNTRGDLYYCVDTDTTYAADPSYWENGEPTPDDEDEEEHDGSYYGENPDYEEEHDGSYYGENPDYEDEEEYDGSYYGENEDYDGSYYGEDEDDGYYGEDEDYGYYGEDEEQ